MDKNMKRQYSTRLRTNSVKFLEHFSSCMKSSQNDNVQELLTIMEKNKKYSFECVQSYREGEDNTETLLHVAVKYENRVTIGRIVDICPDLLSLARETSKMYKGQTALHISITRGNHNAAQLLLSSASTPAETETHKQLSSNRTKMLNTPATGVIFANTVMMGGLPLSVAALTFNEEMVYIMLDHGAEMHAQNSYGDTVLHSLVKYSAVYPNKVENVINMFIYLNDHMRQSKASRDRGAESDIYLEEDSYIWFIENNDHLSPLQLSAKLGVVEVFQYIIKLENVYSFVSTHDGLFDVKLYDITEIDTVANQHVATTANGSEDYGNKKVSRNIVGVSRTRIQKKVECSPFKCSHFDYPKTESILEMMFDFGYSGSSAFRIIETIPVKNIIQEKWQKFRYIYYIWGFLHILLTATLTVEIVIRSDIYATKTTVPNIASNGKSLSVSYTSEIFADIISWTSFVVGGIIYSIFVILLIIAKKRRPNYIRYIFHNLGYICFLVVFSLCLYVDFFMTRACTTHDNYALILAIISGWWFAVFFLRAIQIFSFFTEMIRRVIIGDLFRFAVIISFMLIAFTAAMYAVFVGELNLEQQRSAEYLSAVEENFKSYGETMLTMFKLMLGLGDIEVLARARIPGLAVALYVVFALLTYVLLINSLIAMMSQTCAVVLEDRYPQWRLQQLSVILFLEDLLCLPCIRCICGSPGTEKEIRGFDPVTKHTKSYNRYFLTIHSLQTAYASEEDKEAIKKTFKEQERPRLDGTLRSDDTSLSHFQSSGRSYPVPHYRRKQTTINLALTDTETASKNDLTVEANKQPRRKKSLKKRTAGEQTTPKQQVMEMESDTDLNTLEKMPDGRLRRYHSENIHGTDNKRSPRSVTPNKNIVFGGPLTPVDLSVHAHRADCPENRERLIRKVPSHVDIEPYS